MCLAVPAKIICLKDESMATVEIDGLQKDVSLELVSSASVGDFVIIHVGYALSIMDEKVANETLKTLEEYREIY
jgi:hydrogenase expression/formation protein HypC